MSELSEVRGQPDLSRTYEQQRKLLIQRVEESAWADRVVNTQFKVPD